MMMVVGKGGAIPLQAYYRPRGFQEFEAPRFRDMWHLKALMLSTICTSRHCHPGNIPGTHCC